MGAKMEIGDLLLGATHFSPTPEFADWLTCYSDGRVTIEAGCGNCDLLRAIRKRGCKAIGVDPYRETPGDLVSGFMPVHIENFSLARKPNILIVVARPDHSGWFGEMFDLIHSSSEVLYIGLEKNLETDIPESANIVPLNSPGLKSDKVWQVKSVRWGLFEYKL